MDVERANTTTWTIEGLPKLKLVHDSTNAERVQIGIGSMDNEDGTLFLTKEAMEALVRILYDANYMVTTAIERRELAEDRAKNPMFEVIGEVIVEVDIEDDDES